MGLSDRGPVPLVPEQLADQGKVLSRHDGLAFGDVPKVVQAQAAELCVRAGIGRSGMDRQFPPPGVKAVAPYGWPPFRRGGGGLTCGDPTTHNAFLSDGEAPRPAGNPLQLRSGSHSGLEACGSHNFPQPRRRVAQER